MRTSHVVAFIFGAAAGSAATWYFAKKRYEQIAQEEIDSVKEVFCFKDEESEEEDEEEEEELSDISDYVETLTDLGYIGDSDVKKLPYVITPDEFGEIEEYSRISLTYFSDKVLADDNDEIISNIDDIIGVKSLTHFGQYEDDSVFVRNERLKCDYEILLDSRTYSDLLADKPYLREVL